MPSLTAGYSLEGPSPAAGQVRVTYRGHSGSDRIELDAGSHEVDVGMMPAAGLKVLLVVVEARDADGAEAAPVTVTWTSNAIEKSEELSPGGFLSLCSPSPEHGITALSVASAGKAVVRVIAAG